MESVAAEYAYDFAFQKLAAQRVIDSSKRIDWAGRFLAPNPRYDVKLVHLIRDPRGWYESQKRRHTAPLDVHLDHWRKENSAIRDFIEDSGVTATTVFYDELAAHPEREFPALCDFLGFSFEADALQYWRKAHHGFAANGASSPVLRTGEQSGTMSVFITGDDEFYQKHAETTFLDTRWKSRLSSEEENFIRNSPAVAGHLSAYGRVMLPDRLSLISPRMQKEHRSLEGCLVQAGRNTITRPEVYFVSGGRRHWILSAEWIAARGLRLENTVVVDPEILDHLPAGPTTDPFVDGYSVPQF